MKTIAHPGKRELEDFIHSLSNEEIAVRVGNHLSSCEKCMNRAKSIYYNEVFDFWNAKIHGIAYSLSSLKAKQKNERKPNPVYNKDSNIKSLTKTQIEKLVKEVILKK